MRLFPGLLLAVASVSIAAGSALAAGAPPPAPMNVDDFLVDKSSLTGRVVAVTGSASCMSMEFCSLATPDQAMTSATFDPAKLPRDDRKRLLACNPFSNPCLVTITGTVGRDQFTALQAASITFNPSPEEQAAADPTLPACDAVDESDITSLVDSTPLMKMMHMTAQTAEIHSTQDEKGRRLCKALVTLANGRQINLPYYLKHQNGKVMILANLLAAIQQQ